MNLILLHSDECPANACGHQVILDDRRFEYISNTHRAEPGDQLRCGLIDGPLGLGTVVAINQQHVQLQVSLTELPPQPSQATLILALPRPKVLRRLIQAVTTLGVKEIYLINSYRVEKSYWQSPLLEPQALLEQILLGLEQARDTMVPQVFLRKRFKPFVEDELKSLVTNKSAWIAHPDPQSPALPDRIDGPCCVAIGPEGGFIPYELDMFSAQGFNPGTLGSRILKVETAVATALGRCLR